MWCNFKFEGVLFRNDSRHNDRVDSLGVCHIQGPSKGPHNLTSIGPHLSWIRHCAGVGDNHRAKWHKSMYMCIYTIIKIWLCACIRNSRPSTFRAMIATDPVTNMQHAVVVTYSYTSCWRLPYVPDTCDIDCIVLWCWIRASSTSWKIVTQIYLLKRPLQFDQCNNKLYPHVQFRLVNFIVIK